MTTPTFTKLNLGTLRTLLVLGAPPEFEPEVAALQGVVIHRAPADAMDASGAVKYLFALAFARTLAERDDFSAQLVAATEGDAVVWLAYPKASSRRLRGEFTRDSGWAVLGAGGFEPVRQVSLDGDWSALRFRRVAFIKAMNRHPDGAESAVGRARALAARSRA
jgi:hypothetical protein